MTTTIREPATLLHPQTPFLVVDESKVRRNISRLQTHLEGLGVPLRPHVKTSKSTTITRMIRAGESGPITVSTMAEAEAFAADGFTDILYAVGISPDKLKRVVDLRRAGIDLTVLLDSIEQAEAVAKASATHDVRIPALLEVDCDGHRGGVLPGDPAAITIAQILKTGGAALTGVMTHAGESYFDYSPDERTAAAETERTAAVEAAETLRAAGHLMTVVSVGSTPTAHAARDLTGVTEVRAGNFVFFDLVMAGIGVCAIEDIALSAVVTVIGHRPDKGWILTDGGWTATSRDRGTAVQAVDQGYGLVADIHGELISDVLMSGASQEHGVLSVRPASGAQLPELPIGTRLRILPNHACAMGVQHKTYSVVRDSSPIIVDTVERAEGW